MTTFSLRALLRRWRDERGITVVEMTISMTIMIAVVSAFGSLLPNSMNSANSLETQSQSVDGLVISMTAIARELRSAECIFAPAENTSGSSLHFTSSSNNTTTDVTYAISGGTLTRTVAGAGSVIEADHLVNTAAAFRQISTPRRTVVLSFNEQFDTHQQPRSFTTTVAGRNAWRTCPDPIS